MGMSASQARLLSITARLNDVEFKSQEIANIKIRLADESEQLAMKYTKAISQQKYTYTTYASGQAQKIDLTLKGLMQPGSRYELRTANGKAVVSSSYANKYEKTGLSLYNSGIKSNVRDEDFWLNFGKNYFIRECITDNGGNVTFKDCSSDLFQQKLIENGDIKQEELDCYNNLFDQMMNNSTKNSDGTYNKDGYISIPKESENDPAWLYNAIESGEFMLVDLSTGEEVTASNTVALAIETDNSNFAKAEAEYNAANMKINNKEKLLDNELKKLDTEHNALSTEMDSIKNLIGKNIEKSFNLFS